MKWFLNVLQHYADFSGRARRKEYWMFVLFYVIFALVAAGIDRAITLQTNHVNRGSVLPVFSCYIYTMYLPFLTVTVRRLHDTGRSGWWILINLVPVIGNIWVLVLTLQKGQQDSNRYGLDPKSMPPYGESARLCSAAVTLIAAAVVSIFGWAKLLPDITRFTAENTGPVFAHLLLLAIGFVLLPSTSDGPAHADRARQRGVFPMILFAVITIFLDSLSLIKWIQQSETPAVTLILHTVNFLHGFAILFFSLFLLLPDGQWRRTACTALALASCLVIVTKIYYNYSMMNGDRDVTDLLLSTQTIFPVACILLSGFFSGVRKTLPDARSS
jgi:uncharacterized membrane protein YhaH (DUF805 family)